MTSATTPPAFPSVAALPRAVLVREISPMATKAAIEDCFSFCGPIEELRLRKLPAQAGARPTQQAILVFADELARADALKMDQSLIADAPVSILPVPDHFNFDADPVTSSAVAGLPAQPLALFGSGMSAFGDLFTGVGNAVAAEVSRASVAIDRATESGVLKSAKDQVTLAHRRTRDLAADIDSKWQVTNNVLNAAEAGRSGATAVASAVAKQTAEIASTVDNTLHITENTDRLTQTARSNPTVNSSFEAFTGGFNSLLAQTGLRANGNSAPANNSQPPPEQTDSVPTTSPATAPPTEQ